MHTYTFTWYGTIDCFGELPSKNKTMRDDGKQRKAGGEMRQTWALWNRIFQLGGQREEGTGREKGRCRYRHEH